MHYNLITKIYFPREILPLTGIATSFVDFLIAFAVYIVLILIFHAKVTASILWFPVLLFMLIVFTVGIALILSSLNVYYRDIKLASGFLIQLWFFATPVLYSMDDLPPAVRFILYINPLAYITESMRRCVLEGSGIDPIELMVFFIVDIVVFIAGHHIFIKMEKKFADVI